MRKTYTIYKNGKQFLSFFGLQKSFADGAMAMAEAAYGKDHWICRCDQTNEIRDEIKPRKIHAN